MASIVVLGGGYVGLVSASGLAELGNTVVCVETDPERLAVLCAGKVPIFEPGLEEQLERGRGAGRLSFSGDYGAALAGAEVVFVAVPTPPLPDGRADTSFVFAAVREVLRYAPHGLTIVIKSTVPPGTGDRLAKVVDEEAAVGIEIASNPEFLREGSAIADFMQPDRVVVGATSAETAARVAALYAPLDRPIYICSRSSAELAKYAANTLLATRISFINEVAALCEATSAEVTDVARIVGADTRIGPAFLEAGIGWGGSCFPKDVRALIALGATHGCRTPIAEAVAEVNARQRQRAFELLVAAAGARRDACVAVLGLAFKPNTDDIRESPAIDVIGRLLEEGIHVRAHDPAAMENTRRFIPQIRFCDDPYEAVRDSDALLLATDWSVYRELDWRRVRSLMRGRTLVDGRNALDPAALVAEGFDYRAFGRLPADGRQGDSAPAGRTDLAEQALRR